MGSLKHKVSANPMAKGLAIIITNDRIDPGPLKEPLMELEETKIEGDNLSKTFSSLNFVVHWEHNVGLSQLQQIMMEVIMLPHEMVKDYKCIVFIFSGHGRPEFCGVYLQGDTTAQMLVDINDYFITPLVLLPEPLKILENIPKLFFISSYSYRASSSAVYHRPLGVVGENFLVAYFPVSDYEEYKRQLQGGVSWLSLVAKEIKQSPGSSVDDLLMRVKEEMYETYDGIGKTLIYKLEIISRLRAPVVFLDPENQKNEEEKHLLAVEQAIERKGTLRHSLAHGCFAGPAGSGKSSLMTRLLGQMPSRNSPSTGVANGVVQVEVRRSSSIAVSATQGESSFTWSEILYDEEAFLLANRLSTLSHVQEEEPSLVVSIPISTLPNAQKYLQEEELSLVVSIKISTLPNAQKYLPSPSSDGIKKKTESGVSALHTCGSTIDGPTKPPPNYPSGYIAPKKVFKGSLDRSNLKKLQKRFKKSWSLYLTDTGGQIEFQELLPLLVSGPSIFFITFCLNQDLNQRFTIEYRHPNGEKSDPYQSTLTVKEMILQTLASVASMGAFKYFKDKKTESVPLKPKVFIIGTHRDMLDKDTTQSEIKKIDEDLQKTIKSTSHYYEKLICFYSKSGSQMIYAVDNFNPTNTEFEKIRSDVDRIVCRDHFNVEFPSHWLIFSLVLRQEMIQDRIISYDQCFTIAKDCGIVDHEELNHALWFLHTKVGLVRHFATPGLRDMVIRDPQIMFDQVTRLIVDSFTFDACPSETFKKKGIFDLEDFDKESEKLSLLTPEKLVELLKHLHIVAPFQMHDQTKYFIPCVLAHSDVSGSSSTKSSDIPPLVVTFSCGYCPKGLPGALITFLLTNKMESEFPWKLKTDHIFRDQVSFLVGPYDTITLKIHPTFLELIHFRPSIPTHCKPSSVSSVCHAVRQSVQEGIRRISSDMGLTSNAEHSLNSYCQDSSCIEVNGPHPATEPITEGSDDEPCSLLCKMSGLDLMSFPPPKYSVWFGKNVTEDSQTIPKTRLTEHDVPNLMLVLANYASKWREIGTALQFTTAELDLINSKPLLISNGPKSFLQEMLRQWIQRTSDSPATLEALECALQSNLVGLGTVAEKLKESLEKNALRSRHTS